METFVLRWTKDNLPFWQGVDDGEKIEINDVADVINENAALKRENERSIELLIGFVNSEEGDYDALVHAHRFLEDKCNCDNELPPCRICTLLTKETNGEDDISDLIAGLERAADLFDDIQDRKAKETNDESVRA